MIKVFDAASGAEIGTIGDADLQFMISQLEEESSEDQDYYINTVTLDLFERAGADPALIAVLRQGLGGREEMDIRWERT
jgi:processive 1,2-diacylglycerol beta-glucosyltransferase